MQWSPSSPISRVECISPGSAVRRRVRRTPIGRAGFTRVSDGGRPHLAVKPARSSSRGGRLLPPDRQKQRTPESPTKPKLSEELGKGGGDIVRCADPPDAGAMDHGPHIVSPNSPAKFTSPHRRRDDTRADRIDSGAATTPLRRGRSHVEVGLARLANRIRPLHRLVICRPVTQAGRSSSSLGGNACQSALDVLGYRWLEVTRHAGDRADAGPAGLDDLAEHVQSQRDTQKVNRKARLPAEPCRGDRPAVWTNRGRPGSDEAAKSENPAARRRNSAT